MRCNSPLGDDGVCRREGDGCRVLRQSFFANRPSLTDLGEAYCYSARCAALKREAPKLRRCGVKTRWESSGIRGGDENVFFSLT